MLPEVTRQILHRDTQLEILAQPGMIQVQAGVAEAVIQSVVLITIFPGGNGGGKLSREFRDQSPAPCPFRGQPCGCDM